MWIGDLLRKKQAVAGDGLCGIEIRYGKSSRDPQAWEGSERHGNLIIVQFRTSQLSPLANPLVNRRSSESGKSCGHIPKAHIGLHQNQVANAARVGRAGSRLEHKPAILRVKHWGNDTEGVKKERLGRKIKTKNSLSGGAYLGIDITLQLGKNVGLT
jgi:hypothetical protein